MARLVEAGHPLEAVRGYTLGQADALLAAHARLERDRARDALVIARGAQATAEGFRGLMAALNKDV